MSKGEETGHGPLEEYAKEQARKVLDLVLVDDPETEVERLVKAWTVVFGLHHWRTQFPTEAQARWQALDQLVGNAPMRKRSQEDRRRMVEEFGHLAVGLWAGRWEE